MSENEQLVKFIEKFFLNLKADVVLQGDFLIVSNVPSEFEKFYGKKSPYKFVFSRLLQGGDSDLIEKGSYALKTISSYLENSGQTTLLKIDFDVDSENEIKKRFLFSNCKFKKFSLKKRYNFFFRFTFHTSFQYLNEVEKMINDIYVCNGQVVHGDLSSYSVEEGKKEEIRIPDMKEPYFIAKDELKLRVSSKTNEIARNLNLRFDKEKERIENHFLQESKEFNENLEKLKSKLVEFEDEGDTEKISKQINLIHALREKTNFQELERDKERAVQLEKQKHMLNVNNKLFNTTLIYYPLGVFNVSLANPFRERIIEVSYDPLTKKLNPLFCEVCEVEIKNLCLCATGHVSCKNCYSVCESCGKGYCKKCIRIKCGICSKEICKECSTRCFRCGKLICKTHSKNDKVSRRVYCNHCLRRCERCSSLKEPCSFKVSKKTGAEICEGCFRKEMKDKVLTEVFD